MDEPESTERQLRQSTLSHQPGQYAEPESYGVQKPAFIWPDPVYDPELAVHCAFPTVPLDQPGPSEAFKAARYKARLENDVNDEENRWASIASPGSKAESEDDDDEQAKKNILLAHETIERSLRRGESFKEFSMAVTNDLDWGSPEPEPKPPSVAAKSENDPSNTSTHSDEEKFGLHIVEWWRLTLGAQWVMIKTLCTSTSFASAVRILQLTTPEVITFVQCYIQSHQEIVEWAEEVDRTPVSELIRSSRSMWLSIEEMNYLTRPVLQTDILFDDEVQQASKYLFQVGKGELIEALKNWRGTSCEFVVLPIEPEILASCQAILDKGKGHFNVHEFRPIKDEQPKPWSLRVPEEYTDLNNRLLDLQTFLPLSFGVAGHPSNSPSTEEDGEGLRAQQPDAVTVSVPDVSFNGDGQVPLNPPHSHHFDQNDPILGAASLNDVQGYAQITSTIVGSSQDAPIVLDDMEMDECQDQPPRFPQQRDPLSVLSDYSGSELYSHREPGEAWEQGLPTEQQAPPKKPSVPRIQIEEASPQAHVDNRPPSHRDPMDRLLPSAALARPRISPLGPSVGTSNYTNPTVPQRTNTAEPPGIPLSSSEQVWRHSDQLQFSRPTSNTTPSNLARSFPTFMETFPCKDPKNISTYTSDRANDTSKANLENHRVNSYRSPYSPVTMKNSVVAQDLRFVLKDPEGLKDRESTMNDQMLAMENQGDNSLLVPLQPGAKMTAMLDTSEGDKRKLSPPMLLEDDIDSPATLISKEARKRKVDDDDEDYRPQPKRPRKQNSRKPASRTKRATAANLAHLPLPASQPAIQQPLAHKQTGTDGASQPAKRGRGRPRKNPRPEDQAVQAAATQAVTTQTSINNSSIEEAATPPTATAGARRKSSTTQAYQNSVPELNVQPSEAQASVAPSTAQLPPSFVPGPPAVSHNTAIMANIQSHTVKTTVPPVSSSISTYGPSPTHLQPQPILSYGGPRETISQPYPTQAMGQGGKGDQSRLPQYNNYQEFWNQHESDKRLANEATRRFKGQYAIQSGNISRSTTSTFEPQSSIQENFPSAHSHAAPKMSPEIHPSYGSTLEIHRNDRPTPTEAFTAHDEKPVGMQSSFIEGQIVSDTQRHHGLDRAPVFSPSPQSRAYQSPSVLDTIARQIKAEANSQRVKDAVKKTTNFTGSPSTEAE